MKKLLLFFFLTVSACSFAQDFRHFADSTRFRRRVPGLVYAVVTADSVYEMGGVGYKRLRSKDSIRIDNRFHLGSATSTLTSFIAAQLVAQGKLFWNTTIFQLFPEFRAKARKEYPDITLVDLLSQHAGLPVYANYLDYAKVPIFPGTVVNQRRMFVEWVLQQDPRIRDSSLFKKFRFSNAHAAVATAMLEKVSGKSWEAMVEEYINKPLNVSVRSGWPNQQDTSQPWGHWIEADQFIATPPDYWYKLNGIFSGALDANISLPDYVKFVQDELKGLTGKHAVLSQRMYEVMHSSYPGYAAGWSNMAIKNNFVSQINGAIETFYSHVEIIKEKNIAIIVMANSGDIGAKGAVINISGALRKTYTGL